MMDLRPCPSHQWRVGNRALMPKGRGAAQDSEAAVKAALNWLATNQAANGRWDARRLGGGAALADDARIVRQPGHRQTWELPASRCWPFWLAETRTCRERINSRCTAGLNTF